MCQRACCVASRPQTMYKFPTGKFKFPIDSQIYFFVGSIFPLATEVVACCVQSLAPCMHWGKIHCETKLSHGFTSRRVRWRDFVFQAIEGPQKCKIAWLTQMWSSHSLPNVTRRDGSTSWRVILLCQRACCVASEPQTMCTFWTGKLRFVMD